MGADLTIEISSLKVDGQAFSYNWHRIHGDQEVIFTTDMFDCTRLIGEGKQAVSNYGLPYLSAAHLELLQKCRFVEFMCENQHIQEISKQVINNLQNYYRFRFLNKK
jgi:hypothetical protein